MSATELNSIESDLAATRTRLDSRLGLLQDRFTPGRLADDAVAYLRGSSGSEFVDTLKESVKRNPLPIAVTGIGLAWLIAASQRPAAVVRLGRPGDSAAARRLAARERLEAAEGNVLRMPTDTDDVHDERLHATRAHVLELIPEKDEDKASFTSRVSAMADSVRGSASAGAKAISDGAANLSDQVGDMTARVAGAASAAAGSVGDRFSESADAGRQAMGSLGANLIASPVMLGALGLAAGAVLAALIPQTEQEQAALGDAAGRVRHAAGDAAQDVLDRGGAVAGAVMDKGRSSLQQHGLTGDKSAGDYVDGALSGDVSKNLKDIATEALNAGEAAARK